MARSSTSFKKGDPKRGERKKGTPNAVPVTVKAALDQAAERVGVDLVGFFENIGRQNPAALGAWIVHGSVPRAKEPDGNGGGRVGNLIINVVPAGCFMTEEEALRICGADLPTLGRRMIEHKSDDTEPSNIRSLHGRNDPDDAA
jgi:hypothetical protein